MLRRGNGKGMAVGTIALSTEVDIGIAFGMQRCLDG